MKTGRTYPCLGYELTIKDAADIACVSTAAIRQQLSKLGGSMETVLNYYDKRDGGVIARMENLMDCRGEQRDAADKILEVLCKVAEDPAQEEVQEERAAAEQPPEEANHSCMEPVCEKQVCIFASGKRAELASFNAAIKAIEALDAGVMDDPALFETLQNSNEELKAMRRRVFDDLVDWEAIAEGVQA